MERELSAQGGGRTSAQLKRGRTRRERVGCGQRYAGFDELTCGTDNGNSMAQKVCCAATVPTAQQLYADHITAQHSTTQQCPHLRQLIVAV
eukprot:1157456-Pelagomonas_calceolata.AAC.4